MSRITRMKFARSVLLSVFLFVGPVVAYDAATNTKFEAAIKLFYQHKWEAALASFQEIAETASDLEAIVNARHWSSGCLEHLDRVEEAKAQMDLILQADPTTPRRMEFEAYRAVIGLGPADFVERAQAARSILERYNAPSLREVLESPVESKARLESFSDEEQRVLIGLIDRQDRLEELTSQDTVKLATFIREFPATWDGLGKPSFTLVWCYRRLNSVDDFTYSDETQPPEVFAKYPEGDIDGVVEVIRFQLRDGPIEHRQVDLTSLGITLDGSSLPSFEVETEFKLTPGEPYAEILTITVPVDHLSPGQHSVRVSVSDSGGNSGVSEWTFRIADPPPTDPTTKTLRTTKTRS